MYTRQQHRLGSTRCVGRGSTFVHPTAASLGIYEVCGEREYYLCTPDSSTPWDLRGVWGEGVPLYTRQQHALGSTGCVGRGSTFVHPTAASLGIYGVCGEREYLCTPDSSISWDLRGVWGEGVPLYTRQQHPFGWTGTLVLTQHSPLTSGSKKAVRDNSGHTPVNRLCWRAKRK